jgi:tricorn protease
MVNTNPEVEMTSSKVCMYALPVLLMTAIALMAGLASATSETTLGYYRHPTLHGETIVFTAEGDLWRVDIQGGVAQRLTSHHGMEINPVISPDGSLIAFTAQYEGPYEVYTMPLEGGLPVRRTFEGGWARVVGWSPEGQILFAASRYSTLPDVQMASIDLTSGESELIPLNQASEGVYHSDENTLFFTRQPFQGSYTKRYKGGTAQNIWKFTEGQPEAIPLTTDYPGTCREPMWWNGRLYFVSDRDGTLNIWSMDENGEDLKQHTHHKGWDVKTPSLSDGKIVYQLGADLNLLDITTGENSPIPIRLASDFDQMREKWIKKPFDYLTALHLSDEGDHIVLTARGQVFTAPTGQGRITRATMKDGVRYRQARYMPDGKHLLVLSDESGEVEFWKIPANGIGDPEQLTDNGRILRFDGIPSPDGKMIAYTDKDDLLWIYSLEDKIHTQIETTVEGRPWGLEWSPDSRWLAFTDPALNWFGQIKVYDVIEKKIISVTTDRYNSHSPSWSPDGKWLYFLSDRNLVSLVTNPWGSRQAEPFFDRQTKIYLIPLMPDIRSPFAPDDELADTEEKEEKAEKDDKKDDDAEKSGDSVKVVIDPEGIQKRLMVVPLPPGNYSNLQVTGEHLYWVSRETSTSRTKYILAAKIVKKDIKPDTLINKITSYELSSDRKKALVRKGSSVYVFDADGSKPSDIEKSRVDLKGWTFPLDPRQEWRQMFIEAWRLERDYFYDRDMHGVDWPAMLEKYLPLVDRITDRHELSDLLGELVGELSALHMYVQGGDRRKGDDQIYPASLGAILKRDETAGGYRIEHIYLSDFDEPHLLSPLARPELDINDDDIITSINGVSTLSVDHPSLLLRHQAGKQVLLEIKPADSKKIKKVIVTPITQSRERNLRYSEWEYTRRLMVEEMGKGDIGYVHLRAMNVSDYAQWSRDFYPVFLRKGLIIDARHNYGGNVESWILEKLMRKAWAYWQSRTGRPYSNMQYAFNGHMVVLCDENTYSDGEMFAEGFRRLGLGKVIGTRTWGGEIWLSFGNTLVDRGIASAAESGVYGPEGEWLIEGHGVEPDIVVDNLPHATFNGKDAQLEAAIEHLKEQIRLSPPETPPPPPYPDKSFDFK